MRWTRQNRAGHWGLWHLTSPGGLGRPVLVCGAGDMHPQRVEYLDVQPTSLRVCRRCRKMEARRGEVTAGTNGG